MKRIKSLATSIRRLLVLACLVLVAASCQQPAVDESAACPPQGSETVKKQKLCAADCVIYKTQNGSLFLCAGGNNHQLSGVTLNSANCVNNQIVIETTMASGSKYRDTFDKNGKFIKSEQIP
jgi:hypothetical protein